MDQNNRMEALKRKYGLSQPTNIYSDRRLGTYNVEKDEEEERKRKEQQLLDAKVESVSELSRQDRETPKFDTPRTSMHQKYTDFGRDLKEDVTKVTAERRAMGMSDDEIDDSLIPRTQTDEVTKRLQKIKENIKPGSESLPYQVKEGWMEKEVMNILSSEAVKAMNGKENKMDEVQAFMDANPELQMSADSNFFEQGVRFLGELPRQLRDSTEFAIKDKESWLVAAAVFGAGAALTAATSGAALPMVATTLGSSLAALAPAAAAGIGMSYGSMKHMANLEGGLAYNEYVQDPSVHPDIARQVAMTVGSMNGVVEFLEIGGVLSGIPGSAVAKKLALDKVKKEMAQRALRVGAAYGVNLGSNVLEEVIQESNTSLGMAYAKALSESMKDAPNPNTMAGLEALRKTMTTEEYRDRLGETAIQTLRSMWLVPIATGGIRTAGRQASTALENRAKQKAIKGWYTQEEAMTNSALAEQKKVLLDDNGAVDMLAGNVRNQKDQKSYSYLVSMEPFLKDVLTRSDLTNEERSILVDKLNVINEAISEVEFAAKEGQNDINLAPTSMEEVRQSVLSGEVDRQVLTNDAYIEKYNESVDNGIAEMVREMKSEKKTISEINEAIQKKLPKKQRNAVEANLIRRSIDLVDQETKIQRNLNLIRNFDSVKHLLEENEATEQAQTSETEVVDTNGQTEEQSPSMDVTEPLNDTQTQTETEQVQNTKYEQPKGDIEVVEGKYKPSDTVKVPTGEINIDPKRFQFRFDGTTDKLAGTEWNDNLSGTVLLWENEYGDLYVVNGHHRVSLAQENSIVELDAKILSGVTEQEARAQGALLNIAEGSATSIDVAKYMRDTNTTLEQMQEYGIAPKSKIARDGDALSNLDDGLFKLAATRQIPIERATMIGREFGDDKPAQRSFLKSLMDIEAKGKTLTNDVIQEMIAQEKGMVQESFTEQTLLGEEENTKSLRVERAEVVSYVKDQLRQKKSLLKNVSQKKNAEVLESVGNKIDTEKSMAEMTLAEQALFLLDKTLNQVGTMTNKMFNDFAKQYAKGDKITIKKQALNAFIEAMESGEVLEEAFGKKTASQQATEALTQDNIPGQANLLGDLSQIKTQPRVNVTVNEGTTETTVELFMPILETMEKNPIFNGLEVEFSGTDAREVVFTDKELKEHGYDNLQEGVHKVYGWFERPSKRGEQDQGSNYKGKITLTNGADKGTLLHETIHFIQDRLQQINPELSAIVSTWENMVREQASEQGIDVWNGKELLANALTMGEYGYANDNWVESRLVGVDPQIVSEMSAILGRDFLNAAKGDQRASSVKKVTTDLKKHANNQLKGSELASNIAQAKNRRMTKIKMQLRDNQTVTYYSPDTTTYAIAVPKDTQYEVSIFNEKGLLAKAEMAADQLANKLSEMGLYFNPQEVSYQLKQFNRTQADEVYKGESVRIFKALQNARVGNFTAKDYDTTFTGKLNQRESDDILTNILIAATKGFDKLNSEITFTEYRNRFYSDRSPNELRARVVDGKTEVYYRDFTGYEPRTPDARVPEVSLGIYDSAEDAIGAHRDVPLHQRAEYISEADIQAEYEDFRDNYETYREDFTEEFDGQIKFNVSYQIKNEAEEGSFTKYLNDNNAIDVEGRKTIYDPSINYQLKESAVDVEGFYSNLERVLDDKLGSRGKATDILNMLNKNGVKPEEMEWFRIAEFLEGKDMVTKEEILDHMQERRIKFAKQGMGERFSSLVLHEGESGDNYQFNAYVYDNPGKPFKVGGHFGSLANVIAHTRYTDRTDTLGNKILFIEELQSDLHQQGRDRGYVDDQIETSLEVKKLYEEANRLEKSSAETREKVSKIKEVKKPINKKMNELRSQRDTIAYAMSEAVVTVTSPEQMLIGYENMTEEAINSEVAGFRRAIETFKEQLNSIENEMDVLLEEVSLLEVEEEALISDRRYADLLLADINDEIESYSKGLLPDAPLKNSVTDFMFKTAIKDAVEGGYDRIAWTTGEQQADRYNMRKFVDTLTWSYKEGDVNGNLSGWKDGEQVIFDKAMTESELADNVGKSVATELLNEEPYKVSFNDVDMFYEDKGYQKKTIQGEQLEVGGGFHKKLYNNYIPRMVKKYAKQWGIRPEVIDMGKQNTIPADEMKFIENASKDEIAEYIESNYLNDYFGYDALKLSEAEMRSYLIAALSAEYNGEAAEAPTTQQLSIPVTPEMIEDVMTQGQPLFQVKTEGDLLAVHNLRTDQLANILKLGGIPMPSIAITKADYEHTRYGEATVMFGKDTIDPRRSKDNRVYSGDAYTPTFPQVVSKISESVADRIRDKINAAVSDGKYAEVGSFRTPLDVDNMEDRIDRRGGFKEAYGDNQGFQLAYLKDRGIAFEPVMTTKKYKYDYALMDQLKDYFGDTLDEQIDTNQLLAMESDIRNMVNDYYKANTESETNSFMGRVIARGYHPDALGFDKLDGIFNSVRRYANDEDKTMIDAGETRDKLNSAIDQEDYNKWLDEISEGIIETQGIRNSKDLFTNAGNRRGWNTLHDPVTLDNILRAMKGEDEKASGWWGGIGEFGAAASSTFKSIEDIKQDTFRLSTMDEAEYKAIRDEFDSRLVALAHKAAEGSTGRNSFEASSSAMTAMVDAIKTTKSKEGVKRVLAEYQTVKFTDAMVDEVIALAKEVAQMPTEYFEAKPRRIVGLDEMAAVVLPNDVNNELVTGLQQNGIHLIEFYDKNVEGDRARAVNEILGKNDVSFQVKKTDTNTENFKKWFKDSKVVDEEGNPLTVYHGTPNYGFTEFKQGLTYFSTSNDIADIYQSNSASMLRPGSEGNSPGTYAVYLDIKKPFDTRIPENRAIYMSEYQGKYGNGTPLSNRGLIDWVEGEDVYDFLQEKGYDFDGIIFDEGGLGGYGNEVTDRGLSYVTFSPNQVKSVYNTGAWSAETADMYYQIKDEKNRDFDYRSWTQTVADGQITSPELRALLLSKEFIYEVAHNEDSLIEAARLIEKYGVEHIKEKLDKPVEVGASVMAAGEILTFAYMNQGDTVSAMEMTASMAKKATTMGQGIQILSQWNKQTPTGMLRFVQREFEKLTTKKQKAQVETATGDLTKKAIDINKKAVDKVDVVGAVETVKNLTQEEQNQRKAAKDDKTTTDYVQGTFIDGVPKTEMDTAAIVEIIKEHYKGNGKQNLFNTLVAKGLNEIEAKLLADTVKQQMKDFTAEEMQIAIDETVKGRAEAVDTQMKDLLAEGRYGEALKQMVGQKKNVPVLTSDMVDMIYKRGQEIQQMPTGREKDVETHKLWRDVSEQMPVPKGNKISTFHTMMMLLNFKTIARNLIGNDMFRRLDTFVLNTLGASIDKVYSEMNHTQRTTLLRLRDAHKQQRLGYKDGWTTGLEDALLGIDTSSFSNKFELKAKRSFDRNSAVGKLETVLNIGLRATDRAAVMASYFDSIAEQMQIEGVTEATPQMHERALQLGLYRTFNDETQLSNLFSEAKKTLNIIGLPNRSFGLGDMVLKFPRTPANIMARALDYSPAGLALTIKKIAAEADPYIKQRTAVEGISRAIAGSGVIAIGAQLAIMGILTGSEPDEDKDLYELQKQSGLREFSVNLSAITRWFSGEKNAGELRRGDTLGSYDWAQPLSMPLAIGADTVSGNTEALDFISTVVRSAEAGVTTLIEQPLMTGIANLFRYADPAQGFTNAFRGLPASFSPGIISQVAQAIDGGASNPYSYYSESRQAWNMMANKWIGDAEFNGLPLGRGAIPDRIGVMGEEERWFGDDALPIRLAKSMLSPMILSQYMPSEEAEFLIDLYEASGNPDVIPNSPQRQYTVYNRNDEKMVVKPTPEQFVEWSRWLGENTTKDIASAMRYGKNWSTEDLADEIKYLIGERGDELKERIEDEIY